MGKIKDALDALSALPEWVQILAGELAQLRELVAERGGHPDQLEARVTDLERNIHNVLAEAESLIQRAESQLKSARSAEERARGMENRARKLTESVEGDEEGEDPFVQAGLQFQAGHGGRGPEGGLQDLRPDVGVPRNGKDAARQAKFGF